MKSKNLGITFALSAALCLTGIQAAQAELKRITIGSNPAGSAYFLLAGGFAKLFQQELKIRSTAQPHAGSSVYLPLLEKGELTLGLNSSLDSGMAVAGTAPYQNKHKKVRMIARIWILPYAYMVRESSGIKTLDDLKGKPVTVNVKTNVSLGQTNRTILATAGLSEKDVQSIDSGGVVAGINMVVEGRAAATTVALTMPAMRKAHASVPGGLRILPVGPQATDEFMAKGIAGLYTMEVKPTKTLPYVREPTRIAAFDSYLNASPVVTDDDAYRLAKTLHVNWKKLQKDYPPIRGTPQDGLAPAHNAMPYHPGAIRYWKEVGLWTAANDKQQAKLMDMMR
jgi:TRAP transporter TAXI family solute receptor